MGHLSKNEFSWKKGLCQFLNIKIIYHCTKNQRKVNVPSLRKMMNGQMDGQTEGEKDNHDFAGSSRGPIIKVTLSIPEFI